MRPHRLRWAGIGPYPQAVEINFEDLSSLGLYLIVGPTGAGKTTIFDAITYALFGKLAGARNSQQIISDHDNAAASEVELEFTHRDRRYSVRRRPNPPGKSSKPHDHLLISHAAEGGATDTEVRVTGATRVTTEIESILGLDASQFNRVMLLPQNEFQAFLLANSADKEKLLRSLFNTELFHRAEEELDSVARALTETALEAERELAFTQTKVIDEWRGLVSAGLLPSQESAGDGESSDDDAQISLADLQSAIVGHLTEAEILQGDLAEAARIATEERAAADRESTRYSASVQLAELRRIATEQEPALLLAEASLRSHDHAISIAEEIQRRDTAAQLVDEATALLASARATAESVITGSKWTDSQLTHLCDHLATGTPATIATAFASLTASIEAAQTHHVAATTADQLSQKLRADHARLLDGISETTLDLDQAERALAEARETVEAAQSAALQLPVLREAVSELTRAESAADLEAPTAAFRAAQERHDTASTRAAAAQSALEQALTARTRFLAGELALTLTPGTACPVCGSAEHPTPAVQLPDAPQVDALTKVRDIAHQERTSAELELSQSQLTLNEARQAAATLPSPDERASLRTNYETANDLAKQLTNLTLQVDAEADRRQKLSTELERLKSSAAAVLQEADTAAATSISERSRAQISEETLPHASALLEQLTKLIADIEAATTQLGKAVPVLTSRSEQVAGLLESSEFVDETSVTAAVLPPERHSEYSDLLAAAEIRQTEMTRLEGTIGDRPPPETAPDLTGLLAREEELQGRYRAAADAATRLQVAATRCAEIKTTLDRIGPEATALQQRAARFREIATVVRHGKRPHLSLERWVQRAIFDDVCQVASERIRILSSGRYLLTLDAEEGREKTQAGGLDLYVTDSHTGRTRAVHTLSGGEQFLTSLALALALAEVVQQMSGGIELSSLFIDEGFGSLDGETLDTAVEVLRALQTSGRSVGVISHVEAMQNDLPVGIRVIPGPTGSSLSFPALSRN
jgi:DNA repair protein SbcC/Rad50